MESKTVRIVIVIAIVVGIAAIVGITALAVTTAKASEPRVIDLNEDTQENELLDLDEEASDIEESDSYEEDEEEVVDKMKNAEIEAFNSKFSVYEGTQRGSQVNALVQKIRENNESNPDTQVKALANVQNWDKENNKALADKYYKISCEKDEETGRINIVKIIDAE